MAQYQGPRKAITCDYCLSSNDAQESEEINVVGVAGKLLLGGCCCKKIKPGLTEIEPGQRRSAFDEISALLGAKELDGGLCEKEMAYSRLTALFSDNRLSNDVCEKACSLFNVRCIEDLSYLEDRDIGKLELQLVDCRKLEKLVREVRSQSFKKPAKAALPHAEMPGNVDAEIARFALTFGVNKYTT
jgi:hypothetical protein